MLAFFTTIGLMASLKSSKGAYFLLSSSSFVRCGLWYKNTAGIMIAKTLEIEPIIGSWLVLYL